MYEFETVGKAVVDMLYQHSPLKSSFGDFTFSSSCYELAVLRMPCTPGNDQHPGRQDISCWYGRHVQIPSDTELRLDERRHLLHHLDSLEVPVLIEVR